MLYQGDRVEEEEPNQHTALVSAAQSSIPSPGFTEQFSGSGISSPPSPTGNEPSSCSTLDMGIDQLDGMSSLATDPSTQRPPPPVELGSFDQLGSSMHSGPMSQQRPTFEPLLPELDFLSGGIENIAPWSAFQDLIPPYLWPNSDWRFTDLGAAGQFPTEQAELTPSEPSSDLEPPDAEAPHPSFVGSKSISEPEKVLRTDTNLQTATRFQGKKSSSSRFLNLPSGRPTGQFRQGDESYKPGSFPAVLSATEGFENVWKAEDLGHVKHLSPDAYHRLHLNFERLNTDNGYFSSFAQGRFPSIDALNAFMQLYFEEFHPMFPLLHQPTFDPGKEDWVLLLAVIVIGCRFSRVQGALESVHLLQEFLRRAIKFTTERDYSLTYQPWFVQAALLNQIGMQYSGDMRLIECAQIDRSLIATLCRKVDCFNESPDDPNDRSAEQPLQDIWMAWVRKESMRRLAYLAWVSSLRLD